MVSIVFDVDPFGALAFDIQYETIFQEPLRSIPCFCSDFDGNTFTTGTGVPTAGGADGGASGFFSQFGGAR